MSSGASASSGDVAGSYLPITSCSHFGPLPPTALQRPSCSLTGTIQIPIRCSCLRTARRIRLASPRGIAPAAHRLGHDQAQLGGRTDTHANRDGDFPSRCCETSPSPSWAGSGQNGECGADLSARLFPSGQGSPARMFALARELPVPSFLRRHESIRPPNGPLRIGVVDVSPVDRARAPGDQAPLENRSPRDALRSPGFLPAQE